MVLPPAEPSVGSPPVPVERRRWRPRRRTVLWGVALLAVVGLPATDVTSRQVVQRVVADRIQGQLHTPNAPTVHLDGTPFLTQLAEGRLRRVRLEADAATACHVRISHAEATLTGVRRQSDGVAVDSISGAALLSYDDLSAAVAPLRISAGAPGQVTVSGGLGPLGFTAAAAPRIDGSTLIVEPVSAAATTGFGPANSVDLNGLPPIRLQLRQIPAGLAVGLSPGPAGLAVTFDGRDLTLPAPGCAGG